MCPFSFPQPFSLLLAGRALARETKGSGDIGFFELIRIFLIGRLKQRNLERMERTL